MNKTRLTCNKKITKHTGFTLLELVLVLFLLTLMASATLFLTENVDSQAKYDETKRRMEIIRQAIVGDPTRRLNGQTEISGFAADMGRLPECIAELLRQRNCADSADLPAWQADPTTGIFSGWRGPYIRISPESNGDFHFRDGFANSDASDALNSGWTYTPDASGGVTLISKGSDPLLSNDDVTDPELVVLSDWAITSIPVSIFNNNSSDALPSNTALDLSIVIFTSDSSNAIINDSSHSITSAEISSGDQRSFTFTFPTNTVIPIGNHGYALVCDSDSVFDGSENVFDGTGCTTSFSFADHIKLFTVAPRQTPYLNWTIQ
jgi:type II secretory pathway pseudopilin PulG